MNFRTVAVALLTAVSGAAIYGLYAALAGAAAVAVPSCADVDGASTLTPVTGISVQSTSLVAGHGCGDQAGQVYKFAAVVTFAGTQIAVASGSYDCYTDGVFANLPLTEAGVESYDVYVYAFDAPTWSANQTTVACALGQDKGEPGLCLGHDAGVGVTFEAALTSLSTWTTTCTASQESTIEAIAVCSPLTAVTH